MAEEVDARVVALARRQGGCLTWEQTQALGIGEGALRGLVSDRVLIKVMPRVYASGLTPVDQSIRSHAALLRYGSAAMLSHTSAAFIWGMSPTSPGGVTVSIPRNQRVGLVPSWLTVHRSVRLQGTVRGGLRVTTPARTILDMGQLLSRRDLDALVLQELQRRRVTVEQLDEVLALMGPRGGSSALRSVADEYLPGLESILSKELLGLALGERLPMPELAPTLQIPGWGRVIPDLLWRDRHLIAEADGWFFHGSRSARSHDRARDRALDVAGFEVVRFDTDEIRRNGSATGAELARRWKRASARAAA